MFNQEWRDNQPKPEPEEISAARCLFGAAGILCLVLVGVVLVYVGLSL